ncbi:hypothetical protein NP511_01065 [Natrinema thermotolerans]|uniref:DUF1102 domain-containing protein n=1 Tax=Natrinema thermotolerans TaxID=121872 RepID=A0AAF0PB12_9EURY|nr:hypothetical protein [Natrinema thermotolerans]QCC60568.1 hypothetical protein DVR14_18775 [Natrinema thermotolerans]QCC61456.1 hypothetical protein DVR14_22910 [Natrinema thermotolerans]WMT07610.1 hypothetical protein NP511_19780 [Natrinema thermotolerans]WMT08242.1 hypothetical protein NP511_01065 [Natrinema thermotolerans]
MKRRTVLVGLGALTAGGGVAFGTGAFSRTEAERGVTVSTAVDDAALLRLAPGSGDDGGFVTGESDGTITVEITEVDNGTSDPGLGVNDGSVTGFPKLIKAENQSAHEIELSTTVSPTGGVVLFPDGGFDGPEAIDRLDEPENHVLLSQEESAELGLALDAGYGTSQIPGTVSDGDSVDLEISATDAEN